MSIDEKIKQRQSEIAKVLKECNSKSNEESIQKLVEMGLEVAYAEEVLKAFRNMESDKKYRIIPGNLLGIVSLELIIQQIFEKQEIGKLVARDILMILMLNVHCYWLQTQLNLMK